MSFELLECGTEGASRYETCFLSTVKLTAAGNELRTGSEVFVFLSCPRHTYIHTCARTRMSIICVCKATCTSACVAGVSRDILCVKDE